MHCPRLDHFIRINPNGTLTICGHMVTPQVFDDYEQLQSSQWKQQLQKQFLNNIWPVECQRCQQTENLNQHSIRTHAIEYQKKQKLKDYLIVGGVLDNICNSACQFCNSQLSTTIGKLESKTVNVIDNTKKFSGLPLDRITHLDINGGEPSASKNYKAILQNLPPNCTSIRVNTNCSSIIEEIDQLLDKGVHVTVTVSFDGTYLVHDYVRWPITWTKFENNLMAYKCKKIKLNLWTTVNVLNLCDLENIFDYAKEQQIDHDWSLLHDPAELNVKYQNTLTKKYKEVLANSSNPTLKEISKMVAIDENNEAELQTFIAFQDQLRGINFRDFY